MAASEPLIDKNMLREILGPIARSQTELAHVLYLSTRSRLLGSRDFAGGSAFVVAVSIRAIVADALRLNADAVVIAHNHPSGDVEPSDADIDFTRRLFATLEAIGIRLIDHYIVSAGAWMSFRAARLL